ncbi:MAG TPA: hypothetical protein VF203_06795 [Burkholderiales bacterium]
MALRSLHVLILLLATTAAHAAPGAGSAAGTTVPVATLEKGIPKSQLPQAAPAAPKLPATLVAPAGKAQLALIDARPVQPGPHDPGETVSVRATVRNSGNAAAQVIVALLDGRAPGGVGSESESVRVAPNASASLVLPVRIEPRRVREERFKARLLLLDANAERARGALGRAWRDDNAADNSREITLVVPVPVYNVRARVARVQIHDNCWTDPRAVDRWQMIAHVFRGATGDWAGAARWPARPTGPLPLPEGVRWPANGRAEAADGSVWRPDISISRPSVARGEYLFLYVSVTQSSDMRFEWERRLINGAELVLAPAQWHRGGTFTMRAKQGPHCPAGHYTVTWQITAVPAVLE